MREKACSAVEIVLPPGVFITMTPRLVAASMSMLSTPTPARPMTLRFFGGVENGRGHLGLAAHDQGGKFGDDLDDLLFGQAGLHNDF